MATGETALREPPPRRQAGTREAIRASSPRLRVALAQVDTSPGDYDYNLPKLKGIIEEQQGQTDLLVFPEYTLSGYLTGQAVYDHALRTDDDLFQDLVASTSGITVAMSFIEETGAFNFYDSLAFIRDGQILGIHRKIYLVNYGAFEERKHFSVGPKHDSIDIGPVRVMPFVCADAWSPALVHLAGLDLVHAFVFSACSPTQGLGSRLSTRESWYRMNQFYASMYGVYVLFANRTGSDNDLTFWGGSQIVDPFGRVISASESDKEEVISAEVDLAEVREARTVLHTVRDENLSFLRRRLDRIIQNNYSSVEAQDL
jgi:N-carbamoylputrescine amidase